LEQKTNKFPENRENNREFFEFSFETNQFLPSEVPLRQPFDKIA
jgi:hypothetical protein